MIVQNKTEKRGLLQQYEKPKRPVSIFGLPAHGKYRLLRNIRPSRGVYLNSSFIISVAHPSLELHQKGNCPGVYGLWEGGEFSYGASR